MSILIKGGRVITASDDYAADVLISDHRVSRIGRSLEVDADRVIDADGKYLLPGGVDVHTHMDTSFGASDPTTCDDHTTGTIAAAFGGTTTIVDFVVQLPGESFAEALGNWHDKLERNRPVVDVGFHLIVSDLVSGGSRDDLAAIVAEGVPSLKLFMAYPGLVMVDDETLFQTMQIAAETGALVMVHAENGGAIEVLIEQALAEGRTDPKHHALTRPPAMEGEATNRAIQLAHLAGCPLYVVHVTCTDSLEPIERARRAGMRVWGETCPQYLLRDYSDISRPGFEGAKYVYTPPPREAHHREALWDAAARDVLSVVSTDHAPYRFADQKTIGKDDFTKIPNGAPGVEERLPILHAAGVRGGRFDLNRLVQLYATTPAKLFGLYPRKGTIAVGSDADIVVFDPAKETTVSVATHHTTCDYSLYEGTEVTGVPELVLVRGEVVVEGGELVAKPGHGQFVKRARFGEKLESKES
jgi:dihydropyrimidinase